MKADAARYFECNENPEVFLGATMTIPWVFVTRQQTGIPGLGAWTQHVAKHKAEIEGWQARVKEREKEINKLKSQDDGPSELFIAFFVFLVLSYIDEKILTSLSSLYIVGYDNLSLFLARWLHCSLFG